MRLTSGLILLLTPAVLSAQPRNGLIAEFTFNEKNGRNTANGPDAVIKGAYPTEDRFGNNGYCFFLQGNQDSYINLGSGSHVKPIRGSISLWVRIDQSIYKGEGVEHNPILYTRSHAGDDFNEAFFIGYHFNLRKLSGNNSGSRTEQINLYPAKTIYFREWYHAVLCFDDSLSQFYLNGELTAQGRKGFRSHYLDGDPVLIGVREGPKNKRYLQGSVDDVRFYDRVLTPEEIRQLYNEPDPNRTAVIVRWLLLFAIICISIALLLRFIRMRVNKALKTEQEKNKVKNRALEQEIKMLKAQMNPHFIFNSLNTIQQFILVNDNETAQVYLTRFSKLLRRILESNAYDSISLSDEVTLLRDYLEVESMRFDNVFKYEVKVAGPLAQEKVMIPHFLIQPFAENAIWHGLLPKKGPKSLSITFSRVNAQTISCIIDDNGVGRKKSAEKRKEGRDRSMAIDLVQQRLELLSRIRGGNYSLLINDKTNDAGENTGTLVSITIPVMNP